MSTDPADPGDNAGDATDGGAEAEVDGPDGEAGEDAAAPEAEDGRRPRRRRRWGITVATTVLVALVLLWAGWLGTGGRLFWVGSPSMGETAPVGSLVASKPVPATQPLHVGEIIVFYPRLGIPTDYVHRIYRVLPHGQYMTKGDLNPAPDPWFISRANIIGTPAVIIPAIGWIYKCATWFFFGTAILVALAMVLRRRGRQWVLALGSAVMICVPLYWYRPFIGGFVYASGPVRPNSRQLMAKVVDTGILPVHFSPSHGTPVYAAPGQEVVVTGYVPKGHKNLMVSITAALPWWGWALVVLGCLTPLLLVEIDHRRAGADPDDGELADPPAPDPDPEDTAREPGESGGPDGADGADDANGADDADGDARELVGAGTLAGTGAAPPDGPE